MEVVGHGQAVQQRFFPFYECNEATAGEQDTFFTLHRMPRRLSDKQRRTGPRSTYVGSEVFISLVDGEQGPFRSSLKQLAIETLCTNRDLALHMPLGQGSTDFSLQTGAPVKAIRCVAGPTQPRPSHAHGEMAWRLISHLSLNYLSLTDGPAGKGAAAMARAVETHWRGDVGQLSGIVVTRYGHGVPTSRIEVVEAAHPTPDAAGQKAAQRLLQADIAIPDFTNDLNHWYVGKGIGNARPNNSMIISKDCLDNCHSSFIPMRIPALVYLILLFSCASLVQ